MIRPTRPIRAALLLVRVITAIVVDIANPNGWYALVVPALELIRWASDRWAILLVLAQWAVHLPVTPALGRHTTGRYCVVTSATELRAQARVVAAVDLVSVVATVVATVTEVGWVETAAVAALVLAGRAPEGRACVGFVAFVATVVLSVAAPPEGDTLISSLALKMRIGTVGLARLSIPLQHIVLRTGARIIRRLGFQQTQR